MRVQPGARGERAELDRLLDRLLERAGAGAKLGLERVREALAKLGSPEQRLAVVHVAGTNGKGSTCAMIESIARQAGLSTGLYSSPHLSRFNERIRLSGEPISDAGLADALGRALANDLPRLSFFETLTVAALHSMQQAGVQLAILEVGLGGRLDATNVISHPLVTVITSIGLDHTHMLGSTLAAIAHEKAGIFKANAPAVIGPVSGEAGAAIASDAARLRCQSPPWQLVRSPAEELTVIERFGHAPLSLRLAADGCATVTAPEGRTATLSPGLAGAHQADNAALAAAAAWLLATRFAGIEDHIADGVSRTRWPGRLESLGLEGRTLLLDCAHNLHAARAVARHLDGQPASQTVLIFGALEGKPWRAMLELLRPHARERIYCEPLSELAGRRAVPPTTIAAEIDGFVATTAEHALDRALDRTGAGDTIVVTGSIFLVGRVRARVLDEAQDVVVPL